MVGGVCSGLAQHWNIDPLLVRLAFVLVTIYLSGVAGFMAYVALWLVIPEASAQTGWNRRWQAWFARYSGPLASVFVVLLVFTTTGLVFSFKSAIFLLIPLAIVGFQLKKRPTAAMQPPPAAPRYAQNAQPTANPSPMPVQEPLGTEPPPEWFTHPDPANLYGPRVEAVPVPVPPKRRRYTLRTWSLIAIALGVTWSGLAMAQHFGVHVSSLAWLSATLAVLALALIMVSRPKRAQHGRPAGLILAAVVVAIATALSMSSGLIPITPSTATTKTHDVSVEAASVPEVMELPVGSNRVDLSKLEITSDRTIHIKQDVGDLTVVLPKDVAVIIDYQVDIGEATAPGTDKDGIDIQGRYSVGEPVNKPTLTVEVSLGVGKLEIR